jgi:hypothetical protein
MKRYAPMPDRERVASTGYPWPAFVCKRCGSVMHSNAMWEEHMRSHQRLDAEAKETE